MSAKKIVQEFYKSDAFINTEVLKNYIHPEIELDWNSSKGFVKLNYNSIFDLAIELSKAYVRTKARITHILEDNNLVSVRYSHYVKTVENPREEMFLAHFIVIWEIKDNKLYRGYQMSQLI
jgi:predicted SnoaL-like aldol condensation-catalyzing enzyme